jgi:type I restriction enzyme S subunit
MSRIPTLFEDDIAEKAQSDKSGPNGLKRVKQVGWMPKDWKVEQIGEFGDIVTGTTPKTSKPQYYDGPYPFVSPGDMGEEMYLRDTEKTLTKAGFNEARPIPAGSVLFVCIGSSIGKVAITTEPVATNQQINAVVPNEEYESEYLYYMLRYHAERIHVLAGVQAVPSINKSTFKGESLPVPPQEERTAIVNRLSTWDRAVEQVNALIEKKQERLHGLRQRLLTGEERFPEFDEPWVDVEIGSLLKRVYRYVDWDDDETYDLVSIKRDSQGMVFRESLKGSEIKTKTLNTLREGDFVISRMQVVHGATAYVSEEFDGMHASDSYIILVPRDEDRIDTEFFAELSKLPYLYHIAYTSSYGVHIEKMTFNPEWYFESEVHIPPTVEEQRKIVSFLNTAKAEIEKLKQKRDALKRQKKGLMQRLLTGAVRTV